VTVPGSAPAKPIWNTQVLRSGDDFLSTSEPDEFQFLRNFDQPPGARAAILAQTDESNGILYPVNCEVLSFDPRIASDHAISRRIPGDTLSEGAFIIFPLVEELIFSEHQAHEGKFSRIWKAKLEEKLNRDAGGFIKRLKAGGIELRHLRNCAENWCKPPTTVIHAPLHSKHFKILVETLGIEFDKDIRAASQRAPWWQYAWDEIRRARGEAIQTGLDEHELVAEQLACLLTEMLPKIRETSVCEDNFTVPIPANTSVRGVFRFSKIIVLEPGFSAPDHRLKTIDRLRDLERWRV
jgi:hypothetical protein